MLALQQLPRGGTGRIKLLGRHGRLVGGDLEDAVGGGVDDPAARSARCSSPKRSSTAVPDAGDVAEHAAAGAPGELRDDLARESHGGRSETACRGSTPQISQWPVVLSLPGLLGSATPYAAGGVPPAGMPASGAQWPSPSRARLGNGRPADRAGDVAERVAAGVAVGRRCRAPGPMPSPSSTMIAARRISRGGWSARSGTATRSESGRAAGARRRQDALPSSRPACRACR